MLHKKLKAFGQIYKMVTKLSQFSANYRNVGQTTTGVECCRQNRPCCRLNYELDNMSDVGIQLCYIINHANLKFLTSDPNFSQIPSELTFAMTQFASGGRLTSNTCVRKIQTIVATVIWNNCPRLWPAVFLLTLNTQRQNVHSSVNRTVVAESPFYQKVKQ